MLRRSFLHAPLLLVGCGAARASTTSSSASACPSRPSPFTDTVGLTTREAIEAQHEPWRTFESAPTRAVSEALASVPSGAEVDVFLGTWCGDSRRQITRLFAAIAMARSVQPLPFALRYIAVDRLKRALDPASCRDLTEGHEVRFVPTVIVRREGIEMGRIVEHPTRSVEEDLLDLLRGTRTGFLSLTRTP